MDAGGGCSSHRVSPLCIGDRTLGIVSSPASKISLASSASLSVISKNNNSDFPLAISFNLVL